MGTNTDFTGAIRITPQVSEPLAARLNSWLEIRHMQRDVSILEKLYPEEPVRKQRTLFDDGNFGQDGEFFLPVTTTDLNFRLNGPPPYPEGLTEQLAMNYPPGSCPSLYSDLILVHSKDGTCSYLIWDGAEKSYRIPTWIELLASFLVPRGYHLDGTMFACVEGGLSYYYIHVNDETVQVEDFEPEATYLTEISELL
jgi:hypothetical protein